MRLIVNGQPLDIATAAAESFTVDRLLQALSTAPDQAAGQLASGQGAGVRSDGVHVAPVRRAACAVEVNRRVIPRRDHATATLVDGDRIEIVTLVGGG